MDALCAEVLLHWEGTVAKRPDASGQHADNWKRNSKVFSFQFCIVLQDVHRHHMSSSSISSLVIKATTLGSTVAVQSPGSHGEMLVTAP